MSGAGEPSERYTFTVPEHHAGERLDRVLAVLIARSSRSRIQEAIRAGDVSVDAAAVTRPRQVVEAGQVLVVELADRRAQTAAAQRHLDFRVLHEDEHVAVIDKPASMLAHPTPRAYGATVSELASARWGELPSLQGADRPGIVHRLDANTSGVMVLARTRDAMAELMSQFRSRSVEKEYLALVHGEARFDSGWIESPIERCAARPERMEVTAEGRGRPARTYYEVRRRLRGFTYLACQPKTGRTHQIRVHLLSIQLPIVGDTVYRQRGALKVPLPDDAPELERHALHAQRLVFMHPESRERMCFEAPLPEDMERMLEFLSARFAGDAKT